MSTRRKREQARQAAKRAREAGLLPPAMIIPPGAWGPGVPLPPPPPPHALQQQMGQLPSPQDGVWHPYVPAPEPVKPTRKSATGKKAKSKKSSRSTDRSETPPTSPTSAATSSNGTDLTGTTLTPIEDDFADLIISCIAAYWSLIHPTCPLIHRPTFDAAYSNSDTGSVYSGKPPAALMYALAASGSRRHHDRVRAHHAGKFYADKATSFLLAGYFSPPPDARSVSDLEAVQTLLILADFYTSQSVPSADLIRTLLPITLQVCMDPSTGIIPLGREPVSPEEWIAGEMRCRAWCAAACLDISFAPSESRPLLYDWTRHPVVIPAHESLFDADPASTGFSLVYGAGARPFAVDFSAPAPGGEENPTAMFIEMVGHRFNRGFAAQVPLPLPTPPTTPGLNAGMGMGGYPAMIPAQRPLVFA